MFSTKRNSLKVTIRRGEESSNTLKFMIKITYVLFFTSPPYHSSPPGRRRVRSLIHQHLPTSETKPLMSVTFSPFPKNMDEGSFV